MTFSTSKRESMMQPDKNKNKKAAASPAPAGRTSKSDYYHGQSSSSRTAAGKEAGQIGSDSDEIEYEVKSDREGD